MVVSGYSIDITNPSMFKHNYTIVMGDFKENVGGQTNTSERATGCFGLGQRRGDIVVEWATSKNFKIMNKQFQKKAGGRWTWRSPDGNSKTEIDYIMIRVGVDYKSPITITITITVPIKLSITITITVVIEKAITITITII